MENSSKNRAGISDNRYDLGQRLSGSGLQSSLQMCSNYICCKEPICPDCSWAWLCGRPELTQKICSLNSLLLLSVKMRSGLPGVWYLLSRVKEQWLWQLNREVCCEASHYFHCIWAAVPPVLKNRPLLLQLLCLCGVHCIPVCPHQAAPADCWL